MSVAVITVDSSRAMVALGRFQLSLQENEELMRAIGAAMLVSVRRTFREKGSPANSWTPLAKSTVKKNPAKYGAGHQLLIDRGTLLNSITYQAHTGGVVIGTNLRYAAVHQFGSRDRGGAIGPQAKIAGRAVNVAAYTNHRVTRAEGTGKIKIADKRGTIRTVSAKVQGPAHRRDFAVGAHTRHQNIPARPYLVFRPEDPGRIRSVVVAYVDQAKQNAGLGAS